MNITTVIIIILQVPVYIKGISLYYFKLSPFSLENNQKSKSTKQIFLLVCASVKTCV